VLSLHVSARAVLMPMLGSTDDTEYGCVMVDGTCVFADSAATADGLSRAFAELADRMRARDQLPPEPVNAELLEPARL
jgi:hypothetical protein